MRTILNTPGSAHASSPAPTLADMPSAAAAGARSCRVLRVTGEGPTSERLRELGFTAGTDVVFLRKAPLGDPLCFRLRHTELCIRRSEARLVEVAIEVAP
jgi:ferrous iron transport protein A